MPNIMVHTAIITGLAPSVIEIEASFTRGFAGLQLLGNPSEICREGKERAKIALEHLGLRFPNKRIMLSLNPADIYKDSNHLDLAMAVALANLLSQSAPQDNNSEWSKEAQERLWGALYIGELGLAGQVRPVRGIPSLLLTAIEQGFQDLVLAPENAAEAQSILAHLPNPKSPLRINPVQDLKQALDWIKSGVTVYNPHAAHSIVKTPNRQKSFADMYLNPEQRKLATVIAVGFHNCLLSGPPGTGKTMFAERIPSLLPPLDDPEKIRALKIHGLTTSHINQAILSGQRPVKIPHHSSSLAAVLGNDRQPGDLSLSTGGVLILDEFSEFRRDVLESLREPLVNGYIMISRANRKVMWDANVLLLGTTNNCTCGNWGSRLTACSCSTTQLQAFRRKLSGPLLDRIDLHCNFSETSSPESTSWFTENKSQKVQQETLLRDVTAAQQFSFERNLRFNCKWNRDLSLINLKQPLGMSNSELECVVEDLQRSIASKRSIGHALRVARTLADCQRRDKVAPEDINQAVRWLKNTIEPERGFISG